MPTRRSSSRNQSLNYNSFPPAPPSGPPPPKPPPPEVRNSNSKTNNNYNGNSTSTSQSSQPSQSLNNSSGMSLIVTSKSQSSNNDFSCLLPPNWKSSVTSWLEEDIPSFDIGGFVVGEKEEVAHLFCKSRGMVAGLPFVTAIMESVDCAFESFVKDGDFLDPFKFNDQKICIGKVKGKCRNILLGERTALNVLARCSGIATESRKSVEIANECGWVNGMIAGTRKTTPGFRLVEKYGLLVGGCATHRYDLSQMVMLKDNHIWSAGSITNAVKKAKSVGGFSTKIEVECRNLEEAVEACNAGCDIVMLDNYTPQDLKIDAETIKRSFPHIIIEASGGITNETIRNYFSPYVDVISKGSLTQGYGFVDFSLKIQKQ